MELVVLPANSDHIEAKKNIECIGNVIAVCDKFIVHNIEIFLEINQANDCL